MATRRTTMRSRSGKKLYAVRDESGKFKDIQTYQRAHAADLRHKSKDEKAASSGSIESKVRKAAKGAVKSVKGAVAAVERAAKRVVKKVAGAPAARKATAKTAAKKPAGKKSASTARKPAAKKSAKAASGKTAKKR